MGVSIVLFAACGGQPFSSEGAGGDAGKGGESAGSGGKSTGTGGSKAGSTGKGGSSAGKAGDTSVGGVIGGGGDVSIGGVVGISGTGMTGEAGATVGSCMDPSTCPKSSACVEATCNSGECGEKPVSDGPFGLQVPGDCKQARCEGGEEVIVAEPTDTDDKNPCTKDSCSMNGAAMHVAQTGQQCGNGGVCSPTGACEMCPLDCPVSADPCQVGYCTGGMCKLAPAPIDKLCPLANGSNPGDQYGQCDGAGHCVDCTNSGACDEASVCSPDHKCVPDSQ